MQDRHFSDEELVAYLDGEHDFAPIDDIDEAVRADEELVQRLDSLRIDKALLSEAFDGLLDQDIPKPDLDVAPVSQGWDFRPMAAAACIALMVGFGSGYFVSSPQQPGWKAYVAAYQALYINKTLDHVTVDELAQKRELARVGAVIGKSFDLATLHMPDEVEFKRAQVLGFEGKPLVQLAFLTETGVPMALCILKTGKDARTDVEMSNMEGMSAAAWVKDGYEYLLIGGQDHTLVSKLAEEFATSTI